MKKRIAITTFFICVFLACFISASANCEDVIVSLQIDNPIMQINGVNEEIDEGRGTVPLIVDGRTLVPIRAIVEAFGGGANWDNSTRSVILSMEDDTVLLSIDSSIAYLNGKAEMLDVVPTVINERTMLPIRFVAESFNLAVAWDNDTKTVFIIKNGFDEEEYNYLINAVPEYFGDAYVKINDNKPFFKDYEIITASFEYYSELDNLGRCDVCFASLTTDLMPIEARKSISSVTPTGWINNTYENVEGEYLYNRCHLIAFQLTGENANEKNLITGTRYLNIEGMLPFENAVADYITETGNRVMYRVTPVFSNDNLLADGVLIEAYSVEDRGEGIMFCVYCYNVQPDIVIDYMTGENHSSENEKTGDENYQSVSVYITPTGKRYHFDKECGGKNSFETTLEKAIKANLTPCAKCAS
ncbi:MAG: stalk domain-containing protein [Clostridia bacterium]